MLSQKDFLINKLYWRKKSWTGIGNLIWSTKTRSLRWAIKPTSQVYFPLRAENRLQVAIVCIKCRAHLTCRVIWWLRKRRRYMHKLNKNKRWTRRSRKSNKTLNKPKNKMNNKLKTMRRLNRPSNHPQKLRLNNNRSNNEVVLPIIYDNDFNCFCNK